MPSIQSNQLAPQRASGSTATELAEAGAPQLLLAAAQAAEDKKAEDLRILALDPSESGLTDYFLICNGTNERQNVAISDEIELRLKRNFGVYPNSVEGRREAEWVLMDYVDFIVHIFSPEKRAFYRLDTMRKSAKTLSVDDIDAEVKAMVAAARARAPKKGKKSAPARKATASAKPGKPALKNSSRIGAKATKATKATSVKKERAAAPSRPAKKAAKKISSKAAKSPRRS